MAQNRKHRRRIALLMTSVSLATIGGCARRAPSAEQCVHFAELRYGVGLEELVQAGAAKATFDRLVATCLEVPFEQKVIDCAQASHQPMDCLRRIQPDLFGDTTFDFALRSDWPRERF